MPGRGARRRLRIGGHRGCRGDGWGPWGSPRRAGLGLSLVPGAASIWVSTSRTCGVGEVRSAASPRAARWVAGTPLPPAGARAEVSGVAGRGSRGRGCRSGGRAVPSPHPHFRDWSISGKTEWEPVPRAGAVTPEFSGEDCRLGPAAGLCTLLGTRISRTRLGSLTSLFNGAPPGLALSPAPTPLLPDPVPGKVQLSKSGLFWGWGWGRVPVGLEQRPAGLRKRIRVVWFCLLKTHRAALLGAH